jgi:hypothetical protein
MTRENVPETDGVKAVLREMGKQCPPGLEPILLGHLAATFPRVHLFDRGAIVRGLMERKQ